MPVPFIVPVPPLALTVTIELPPLHRIGVLDELASTALGWVIFPVVVSVQLLASVTVNEYVPAARLNVPVPKYGAVPPVALTVTTELPPLHRIGVLEELGTNARGCVMFPVVVWVQLLVSVTVNEYVPAARLNVPVPE